MKDTVEAEVNPIVDTYNWDTAFALNFTNANTAIANNWPNIGDGAKNVSQAASDMPAFHIDGVLKPWQLVAGGDGKNIRMRCIFDSGTYSYSGGTLDLATGDGQPVAAIIEVGMEWVPEPGQKFFVINDNPTINAIKVDLNNHTIDAQLTAAFTANKVTLTQAATVTPKSENLEWLIEDGADNYYIFLTTDKFGTEFMQVYKFQEDWNNILQLLSQAVSASDPAVTIISIAGESNLTAIPRAVLEELLSTWFTDNLGEFNHVFASISLAPTLAKDKEYAWIKPTGTGYAVVDEGTANKSIFGVLNTALHHDIPANHQVSPNIIPDGADAGFAIAGPDFVTQMLLPSAQHIFNNAPASAFSVMNDGLSITNTKTVVWGKFMMDEKKEGSISNSLIAELDAGGDVKQSLWEVVNQAGVRIPNDATITVTTKGTQWLLSNGDNSSTEAILNLDGDSIDVFEATIISIDKGGFKVSLVNSFVQIEFIDLHYSYSSSFDVHVNYTEQMELTLRKEAGKQIFWFNQIKKDMVVNVTKTQAAITREIVEGAIMAVLALVAVAGPIIEGLSAGAEIVDVTEDAGEAVISAEAFEAAEAANPEAAAADDAAAGGDAAEEETGRLANIKRAFLTPKWKFMGALVALSGAVAGVDKIVSAIIEAAAKKEWENVPGFDLFAQEMIKPYSFPDVSSFELESAQLQQSLVVGFTVK